MVPDAGRTNPDSTLKNVVLPAPFGPMSPQTPCSNVRLILSREVTPPYLTVRSLTSITLHHLPKMRWLAQLRRPRPTQRLPAAATAG